MNRALKKEEFTLLNIAMVRAWNHIHEYNPYSGQAEEKQGGAYIKEGYIEGFLAGFAYKFESGDEVRIDEWIREP